MRSVAVTTAATCFHIIVMMALALGRQTTDVTRSCVTDRVITVVLRRQTVVVTLLQMWRVRKLQSNDQF